MGLRRWIKNVVRGAVSAEIEAQGLAKKDHLSLDQSSSAARPSIYVGQDRLLTKTKYGHKMFLVASDVSLTPHIAVDGYWEEWITNIFMKVVKPGMQVVDVGANVGYYTLLAAQLVGEKGHVTAFEANKELADVVYRNLQINGYQERSTVIDKAVFSESKTLNFSIYKNHKGSSGLWGSEQDAGNFRDEVEIVQVEAVSLDEQFAQRTPDLIKIDAEGAEGHVLMGARQLMERNRNLQLLIEYNPHFISGSFGSLEAFHSMITSMGFEPHLACHDSTLKKMTFAEIVSAGIQHCDLLLKRPG